jgi:outer membrane protein TolC
MSTLLLLLAGGVSTAQEAFMALDSLSLKECIEAASGGSDDARLVEGNLAAARAQHALALSKNEYTLSATGGYSSVYGLALASSSTTSGLLSRAGASDGSGWANSVQGALSLANPKTKVGLSLAHNLPPFSGTKSQSSTMALSLSHSLTDGYPGGQAQAAVEKSMITLQGKELSAAQSATALVAKVRQYYISALGFQRTIAARQEAVKRTVALLIQIETLYSFKQATTVDLQKARINAKAAELDLKSAQHDYKVAASKLANLIGRPIDRPFQVAELEDPVLPAASVEEAVALGLSKRVEFLQVELNKRSAAIDLALVRAQTRYALTLTGGANFVLSWASPVENADSVSAGIRIALPLVDGGVAARQESLAAAQGNVVDLQASQLRRTISADIRDAFEAAQLHTDRIALAASSLDLAKAQFELIKTQLSFGMATNQDLLDASVSVSSAAAAVAKARSDYALAVLALSTAMGL